jgi:hypothetical protein
LRQARSVAYVAAASSSGPAAPAVDGDELTEPRRFGFTTLKLWQRLPSWVLSPLGVCLLMDDNPLVYTIAEACVKAKASRTVSGPGSTSPTR